MNLDVYNIKGEKSSQINVADTFSGKVNEHLFYEVVKMQMANKRSGTASTKTRAEVSGGGAKPWKQKGSGRARAGSSRSPIWRHGGTCFGPKPRDYSYKVPKKVLKGALKSAITLKINDKKVRIYDTISLEAPKTKLLASILGSEKIANALIVTGADNDNLKFAARNLKGIKYIASDGLNVYDILAHDLLIMTKEAYEKVEGNLS